MAASTPQSQASMLATITSDLDRIAPRFEMRPEQIEIIQTPAEFYETLKSKISKAKYRIYLSTLYIGKTEHELISTIRTALHDNPNLHVSFLTDALRGTRETPDPCSASLMSPLISEFGPGRVEVRLYHTPNLTGLRKSYIPKRINEGWGLQHMKLYGVDDEIIMSGANLSEDYFTNRQDRYHLFRSKELTDYFAKIHDGVAKLSFDVQPSNKEGSGGYMMDWPKSNVAPSPLDSPSKYKDAAAKHLAPLLTPANSPTTPSSPSPSPSTTAIYPILSLVPLIPTSTELPALTSILTHLTTPPFQNSSWTFTAGYFNMTPSFRVSGMLPAAYTHLAKSFLRRVKYEGLSENVVLKEWKKEANVVIATTDPGLRRRLAQEVEWLGKYARAVDEKVFETPERKVGLDVRLAMWAVRVLGGAL
ncbi:CDP-diacylglycerol-glycerol-3-phosphate 3-phosphatidyltransferase [Pyrenophora tritici-repentis]|nr:CDP-diacylglycerol-glycerol-3-phosphate 3-phosphatidyltransferase [Pyrenophora tritici-repentis]KAF7454130.1 CDP-diacylglycerol-glycerol-3-phosphate 3-phosphatidyltransferase [Pyrenophora tritici-repentis]KAI0579561.1 CDP-diacylglycerol-glycerol-3-phosphate 3-phosphatidyltransferase [Pyrenophora tritici-repentis]KAI0585977.1 CDP-diacylglycerol-glycerol-3-phosphate 3-phosphatidyltransferase [Pyrenophora tritici-repentis]KAI0611300.1 CDP-diacylglycerol-glycerol-3-phosphate 3-phosphatidyltransf